MYLFVYIGSFTSTFLKIHFILEKVFFWIQCYEHCLFSIAFKLDLLFDPIYSQQKNNTTLTAFDLFNFVLLIVYLITYRFSWRCLISISKHLYICISRTYKTVFIYFYWHLIWEPFYWSSLQCSAKIIWHINSWFNFFKPYHQV